MDNYGGKLIRFKGEDEYMINTLSFQEYWDSVLKTTSLASEDVSVLVFIDKVEYKEIIAKLLLVIKESAINIISKERNLWKFDVLKAFFNKNSKLKKSILREVDSKNRVILLENKEEKIYFDSIVPVKLDLSNKDKIITPPKETPKTPQTPSKVPAIEENPEPSGTVISPYVIKPPKPQEEVVPVTPVVPTAPKEYCDDDDFKDYLKERTREYCDTTNYKM